MQAFYFIGINGVGMSALARYFLTKGSIVRGSDASEIGYAADLRELFFIGHESQNLASLIEKNDAQWTVVVNGRIKDDNPEVAWAKQNQLPIVTRGELLARIAKNYKTIAITGTHGKTTTTGMIATMFVNLGLDPTVFVGGLDLNYKSNFRLGKSEWLICEADESDGSFTLIDPCYMLVTNVDKDHLDFFGSLTQAKKFFYNYSQNFPAKIIAQKNEDWFQDLPVKTYESFKGPVSANAEGFLIAGRQIRIFGQHNLTNLGAVIKVGQILGFSFDQILDSLVNFQGIKRRFEILRPQKPKVIDDYAHNPVKIAGAIQAAKEHFSGEIAFIWEPHRFSRLSTLKQDFITTLTQVKNLFIGPIFYAEEKSRFDLADFKKEFPGAYFFQDIVELYESLISFDVVIFMGAGVSNLWAKSFCKQIENPISGNF